MISTTGAAADTSTATTSNLENSVINSDDGGVPKAVSEWAERNHGAIRTISTTDDGDYTAQIGKLHTMGSQLVESTLQEVRGVMNASFASPTTSIPPPSSTTPPVVDNTSNTTNITIAQIQHELSHLIEKRDARWRPDTEELHAVKRLLTDANLLLPSLPLPPPATLSSKTSSKANKKSAVNPTTTNPTSSSSSAPRLLLPSIEALITEVLSLRSQSSKYSMVVSNVVGGGTGGAHHHHHHSPSSSATTLLPPISASPSQKTSNTNAGGSGRQYISSSHDQLTQALKKASSSQQQQHEGDTGNDNNHISAKSPPLQNHNGSVEDSKRQMRKNYEDMYVRGEERQHPRPCYVALGESEDRRTALRGATVVQDNAHASLNSNTNTRSNANGGNGGIFANEPGSVTWASTANAHKYSYDSNTQQYPRQPRHGGGHQSTSPDLYVGVRGMPGGPAAQGGPIPLNAKHRSKVAAVVTQRNPFFRHHNNHDGGGGKDQHSLAGGGGVDKVAGEGGSNITIKAGKGRILSEIERKLEDGYRTHKFVTVDVAAEREGLEYIEDDDDEDDADNKNDANTNNNATNKNDDDDDDEEFDAEVSMLHDEMQSEEKRDQKYREKKRRKPGAGAGMAGVALGTGSGLVVTEAEVTRRAEQAQLLRTEEAARIRAGGKQKRSQVQMMVSNNFAKMAAKGDKVDPFAMVRYGDIETIQDRRRASTGAIQAVLQTVAQEVQQYKISQSGGGTAATLPGGEEDRRVVPTLRPSQSNCATTLQSNNTSTTSEKRRTGPLSSSSPNNNNTSTNNPNRIAEATMRQLASKSKVHRGPPRDSDDDDE